MRKTMIFFFAGFTIKLLNLKFGANGEEYEVYINYGGLVVCWLD